MVLYNYLLTLDEDIDFCKGAINSEWDEFEDIIDFQNKTAGDTCPEYPTIKQLKEETTVLLFEYASVLNSLTNSINFISFLIIRFSSFVINFFNPPFVNTP
jgi:hypothetical protein